MSLSKKIVQILYQIDEKEREVFFDRVILWLKKKKMIKILPDILKEIERKEKEELKLKKSKLILRSKKDFDDFKEEIEKYKDYFDLNNMEIKENENIVGGFILKNKKFKLDFSFKKKLLELYNKIIS